MNRDALKAELDDRFYAQLEEARKKLARDKREREAKARNRRYGLAKRHERKEKLTR